MTFAQVKAFLAACEFGSFTAAAVELDITQASVSALIARLEQELGVTLFMRGARRLVPTAAATELRFYAEQSISALENGVRAVRSVTSLDGGVSTFGVLRNAGYYDLADLVQRFHRRYPKVKVRLVGLNSYLVAEAVVAGEIECGVVILPVDEDGLTVKPLFKDEVFYISTTRDARAPEITIQEFSKANLVLYDAHCGWKDPTRRQLLERAQIAGVKIDAGIEVENVETAINLVSTGAGDSIVSRTIAHSENFPKNIRTFRFADPLFDTVALVQRETAFLSPATKKLAELAERALLAKVGVDTGRRVVD